MMKPSKLLPFALLAAGLSLGACFPKESQYQGLSAMHRAEVSLTRFAHDSRLNASGGMDEAQRAELLAFLSRIDIRYGDRIQIDRGDVSDVGTAADVINAALYPHGLRVDAEPIVIGSFPEAGTVRIVVTRHLADMPRCPNYSQPNTPNHSNAPSSNFSCSNRTNLAAQVANPADLVGGTSHAGPIAGEPEKAIDVFRTRELTGSQPLQSNATSDAVGGAQ